MINNVKGISFVSVLVGLAISGIVAATISALYENMTRLNFRANVTAEVDNLQRYVQGVLAQPRLCRHALKTAAGTPPSMPTSTAPTPLGYIQVFNGDPGTTPVRIAETGMALANRVTLTSLALRHRDNNGDEVGEFTSGVLSVIDTVEHRVFPAEVVMTFTWPAGPDSTMVGGKVLQTRKIPLMVTQRVSDSQIVLCDTLENSINQADCQASCPAPGVDWTGRDCTMVGYLEDVDTQGEPICKCIEVCSPEPTGPPDTSTHLTLDPGPSGANSSSN